MHYGALFLALAMYLLLKHENRQRHFLVFLAGASLGLVALFKHNIGAYALLGSVLFLIFENLGNARQTSAMSDKLKFIGHLEYRGPLVLLIGSATAIAPALGYMQLKDALAPMTRTLLFGPGEFLLNRLAIPLSPATAYRR